MQRLWRYLNADPKEQEAEDERLTPFLPGIAEALARAKFGVTLNVVSANERNAIEAEAKIDEPRLRKQLNDAARERFGKPFSKLRKAEKAELLQWLSDQY